MKKMKIKGVEFEAPEATVQAFDAFMAELETKAKKPAKKGKVKDEDESPEDQAAEDAVAAALEARIDALTKEIDSLKAQLSAASAEVSDAAIDAKVAEKVEVLKKARALVGDSAELKGSTQEIKVAALKSIGKVTDGKSAEWVSAYFDAACECAPTGPKALRSYADAASAQSETVSLADSAYEEYKKRLNGKK